MRLLEKVQWRWIKFIAGFDTKGYRERLALIDLFSVKGRSLRADKILVRKILHDKCAIPTEKVFTLHLHAALMATERSCIYQTPKLIAMEDFSQ